MLCRCWLSCAQHWVAVCVGRCDGCELTPTCVVHLNPLALLGEGLAITCVNRRSGMSVAAETGQPATAIAQATVCLLCLKEWLQRFASAEERTPSGRTILLCGANL